MSKRRERKKEGKEGKRSFGILAIIGNDPIKPLMLASES